MIHKIISTPNIVNRYFLLCRETIYIDEEKKYMRLKQQNTKEWFNSYLTFQHIKKKASRNLLTNNDRDNMWLPIYSEVNSHSMSLMFPSPKETLKIIPHPNFDFTLIDKTEYNNARLFKVDKYMKIQIQAFTVFTGLSKRTSIESHVGD